MAARLLVAIAAVATLLVGTSPAAAHTHLESSQPLEGELVATLPDEITLNFSMQIIEPMRSPATLVDPEGRTVPTDVALRGASLVVSPRHDDAVDGRYTLLWQVVARDEGHLATGTFSFYVGDELPPIDGAQPEAPVPEQAVQVPRSTVVAFTAARLAMLASVLLAAGTAGFAALVMPHTRPPGTIRLALVAALTAGVAYALDAATIAAVPIHEVTLDHLRREFEMPFGRAMAIVGAAALVTALAGRATPTGGTILRTAIVLVPALALAASVSLQGHATLTEPTWLRLPLDMLHMVAGALWAGGLVQLWLLARRDPAATAAIDRYSRLAGACIGAVLVSGAVNAWLELGGTGAVDALQTPYGRLIAAKAALLVGIAVLALVNRSLSVPSLRSGHAFAPTLLREYATYELMLLSAVLVATAIVMHLPQPLA